jgi:hypothetical protein
MRLYDDSRAGAETSETVLNPKILHTKGPKPFKERRYLEESEFEKMGSEQYGRPDPDSREQSVGSFRSYANREI